MKDVGNRGAATPRGGRAQLARLLGVGLCGLIYLAYAVGWGIAAARNPYGPEGLLPNLMYETGQILAVLAAPGWFAATVLLSGSPRSAAAWLVAGLVLLAPLPLVIGVP